MRRAHIKTMLWKLADHKDLPTLYLSKFSCKIESITKYGMTDIAQKYVLKVIACTCRYSRNNCSCNPAGQNDKCNNENTKHDDAGHCEDGETSDAKS